jgi:hypothetical protein
MPMKTEKRRPRQRPANAAEKSLGTRWAEQTRAACNKLTDAEREKLLHRAMQIAYGAQAEPAHPGRR